MDSQLNAEEMHRYSRHLLVPEIGIEGQLKIKQAKVLIIGAGGLGSPVLLYLAAAGVGTLGIADFDSVDRSNLQRQILYADKDVGLSKAEKAAGRVAELNPQIEVRQHRQRITADNALDIFSGYDIIVDGTDNFSTRYLVSDACVLLAKPNVHGSIYRFEGQASVFCSADGPCYRCLFPEAPKGDAVPNCAEAGVLGVMAGTIGCIQAGEALKIILGIGRTLSGRLLLYDALAMTVDSLPLPKNPDCISCGTNPLIKTKEDLLKFNSAEIVCDPGTAPREIGPRDLHNQLQQNESLLLLDVRTKGEVAICKIAGSQHIPLADLPAHIEDLNKDARIVVYCKSGMRSQTAQKLLEQNGFKKVLNLRGGINAWRNEVEPELAFY